MKSKRWALFAIGRLPFNLFQRDTPCRDLFDRWSGVKQREVGANKTNNKKKQKTITWKETKPEKTSQSTQRQWWAYITCCLLILNKPPLWPAQNTSRNESSLRSTRQGTVEICQPFQQNKKVWIAAIVQTGNVLMNWSVQFGAQFNWWWINESCFNDRKRLLQFYFIF